LDGHAQRVPTITGSVTELVTTLDKEVTVDQVNEAVKKYTDGSQSFGYNDDEIVSSDVIGQALVQSLIQLKHKLLVQVQDN
jgi:Glyceraldehyde-3-phosphate dehydrogenase/erythrose-4-phosphate dehydrogenase